jgi:hypothetical protein
MAYNTKPPLGSAPDPNFDFNNNGHSCYLVNEGSGDALDKVFPYCNIIGPVRALSGNAIVDWAVPVANSTKFNWTGLSFSILIWFRCVATTTNGQYYTILGRANYASESSNQGWAIQAYPPDNGQRIQWNVFRNNGSGSYTLNSNLTPVVGTDYFIACTSDGVTRRVYVNGVLQNSTTNNPVPLSCTAGSGLISKVETGAPTGKFPLYEVQTFGRCLTQQEITNFAIDPHWNIKRSDTDSVNDIRLSQYVLEPAIESTKENIRLSQAVIEPVIEGTQENIRLSQANLEVVASPTVLPYVRMSQCVIEVVIREGEAEALTGSGGVIAYALLDGSGTST